MSDLSTIQKIAVYAIPLIFAITIHEAAHAYVADRCGDNTARILGRLSLNPIRHIDPIGTLLFPMMCLFLGGFIFGWAKPVPIGYNQLHNPKRDMFWVALAGPASNFAMALIWVLIFKLSLHVGVGYFAIPLNLMAQAGVAINISLMLLNLLPILPLDGGRIVFSILPPQLGNHYARTEPYGFFILIILLVMGGLSFILQPLYTFIISYMFALIQ